MTAGVIERDGVWERRDGDASGAKRARRACEDIYTLVLRGVVRSCSLFASPRSTVRCFSVVWYMCPPIVGVSVLSEGPGSRALL